MTISVDKARRLVISSCQTRSGGVPDALALDAALEVYVEAVNATPPKWADPPNEPLADWERELLAHNAVETWRGGDRVRMSGVSKYGRTVNGLIGVVDDSQFHRPLISVTPEVMNGVLVTAEQLTRI